MNYKMFSKTLSIMVLMLSGLAAMALPSFAAVVTVDLKAEERTVTMPDGNGITMWGFFPAADAGTVWAPGATPAGLIEGDTLVINLTNNLPEPVSIVIPGQPMPTVSGGIGVGAITDSQGRQRLTSFTGQAGGSGGTATYTWTNLKAGTYLYQSGSHPAKQVHMGLYGALVVIPSTPGAAYEPTPTNPDTSFDAEVVLLYSEIDPALHDPPTVAQPFNYKPKYFLINGQPYAASQPPISAGSINQNVLIRFLNAGLKNHAPTLLNGGYMKVIAEDGNLYPYPKQQYSVLLAAGKTIDAVWSPTAEGSYPIYDRTHHLTSAGIGGGGMLDYLQVAVTTGGPVAVDDAYSTSEDAQLIQGGAGGVLSNDTGTGTLSTILVNNASNGVVNLNADGSFTYTPNPNFNGTDNFTYKVFDGVQYSNNVGTVTITVNPVNDAPIAANDTASTPQGIAVTIAVLTNDTDVDGDALSVIAVTQGGNGSVMINADNTVTYTPTTGFTGSDSFTYTAFDGTANSNVATVTITVNAAPTNIPPVALDDYASTTRNVPVFIGLFVNDYDPDGTINPNSVIVTTPTRGGTVQIVTDGVIFTPKKNFRGTDVFTYTVQDNLGATSNEATVRVNVN